MLLDVGGHVKLVLSEAGFTFCNCIYVDDDVKAIIDTGADVHSLEQIDPPDVDMVLYTHHHYDHIRGHRLFTGAQTYIHEKDACALADTNSFEYYNSIDRWGDLMPGIDYRDAAMQLGIDSDQEPFWNIKGHLQDKQVLQLGSTKIEVLHTPGHSAGHCSFWFPDQEFLFTGDICLTQAGPWYGEIWASPDDMMTSIDRLIDLQPPRVASCHINKIETDAVKTLQEFKQRIFKRDERIHKYLQQKPADLHEIAEQRLIYRYHPTAFVLFWEKLMVIKHLERLVKMGVIQETESGYFEAV